MEALCSGVRCSLTPAAGVSDHLEHQFLFIQDIMGITARPINGYASNKARQCPDPKSLMVLKSQQSQRMNSAARQPPWKYQYGSWTHRWFILVTDNIEIHDRLFLYPLQKMGAHQVINGGSLIKWFTFYNKNMGSAFFNRTVGPMFVTDGKLLEALLAISVCSNV